MHASSYLLRCTAPIGKMPHATVVGCQKIEAVVVLGAGGECLQIALGRLFSLQEFTDEKTPRTRIQNAIAGLAKIGQRRKSSIDPDAEPCAILLKIAPSENLRAVRPDIRRSGRSFKKFVAIRCKNQRVLCMCLPGKKNQAHRIA